jgi:hypothetical protein
MHGHTNVKFVNAKQAKEKISIETPKKNFTKPRRQYGITKYAEKKQLTLNYIPIKNQFHPGPARMLSTNLYDIYHFLVYSE